MHVATVQTGYDMLERDLKAMKDNYDRIYSENWQLNALFTRQQKDKEKRRARDEALKEARDKARVEEEEGQAVRDKCDRKWRQDLQFERFLDYKRKSIRHILLLVNVNHCGASLSEYMGYQQWISRMSVQFRGVNNLW